MDLKLKVLEGKNAGQEISVNGKKFFIGRAEDCHLRPGSDLISRHHCVLLVEDGYIGIRDFGSKNGTYVNDERVAGERELKPGDRLSVGPLRFEIHVAHNIGAKKRPPVGDIKEAAARTAQVAAAAQGGIDVDAWISDTPPGETKATDTQTPTDTHAPNLAETDSIKLANTQTVYHSPSRPGPVVQTPAPIAPAPIAQAPAPIAQAPAPVAPAPAPIAATPVAKAPTPVAPAPAPVAPAPQPAAKSSPPPNVYQAPPEDAAAPESAKGPAGKRTPGKLPTMPNSTKDSQEAAAAMLNKLRKRR